MWLSLDPETGVHHIVRQVGWPTVCKIEVRNWIDSEQIKGEVRLCQDCCTGYSDRPGAEVREYRRGFRSPGGQALNADYSVNTDPVVERLTPTIEEQIKEMK